MTDSQKKMKEAKRSAERALDEVRNAAEKTVEAGRARLDETRERLSETGSQLSEGASQRVRGLRDGAISGYERAYDAVGNGYGHARKTLGGLADDCRTYVREHPGIAFSAAVTAGLLAGLLIRRGANRDRAC
jgi:ElaB/YqjD/DUF883 family membrane-anchored ribosome-binding protein